MSFWILRRRSRLSTLLVTLVATLLWICPASADLSDPAVHTEYRLPWEIGGMAADPIRNLVYVLNPAGPEILALNTETGRVDARAPLAGLPGSIAFSVDGNTLVVSLPTSNSVQIFSPGILASRDIVKLTFRPGSIVLDANGYMYAISSNYLRKVDLRTGAIVGSHGTYPTDYYYDSNLLVRDPAGTRLFIMEMGLSGGSSGVSEYLFQSGGMPTYVADYFDGKSNDIDLSFDPIRNTLYRSSGGIYGLGVYNLTLGGEEFWPFTDGAPYGVANTQLPSSDYVYAGSGSAYDGRVVKYRKVDSVPVFTYRTDSASPTGKGIRGYADIMRGCLEITPNGHLVYGKDDYMLGLIGQTPLRVNPVNAFPYVNVGANPPSVASGVPFSLSALVTDDGTSAAVAGPVDNLLAYWKLDTGTQLVDSSGNNRNATASGAVSTTGKINSALSFSAPSQQFVNLNNLAPAFASYSAGAISFWFRTTQSTNGTLYSIADSTTGQVRVRVEGGFLKVISGTYQVASSLPVNDGEWHHLALSTSNQSSTVYLDGDPVTSLFATTFFNVGTGAVRFNLGRFIAATGSATEYLTGALDDVRIYSRALTQAEAYQLAAGRLQGSAPTVVWSKKSGPGQVRFSNPNTTNSSATIVVPGDYVLQATGSDGEFASSDCLYVTVPIPAGAKMSDLYYKDWAMDFPGIGQTLQSATEDADGDRLTNFAEYLSGSNPVQAGASPALTPLVNTSSGNRYFEYAYTRRSDAAARGLVYTSYFSSDLSAWYPQGLPNYPISEVQVSPAAVGFESVRVRVTAPLTSGACFVKVQTTAD